MADSFETEVWVPDLVERCQDALTHSWRLAPEGECWYLSRSVIERFLQEDDAGNDLPDEWRKLVAVANLPPSPDFALTGAQFEVLRTWSKALGGKLDLNQDVSPPAPVEEPRRRTPQLVLLAATLLLLPSLAIYIVFQRRFAELNLAARHTLARLDSAQAELSATKSQLGREQEGRLAAEKKGEGLSKENRRLLTALRKSPPPQVSPSVDLSGLLQPRTAAGDEWTKRTPAFTAVLMSPPRLVWPAGRNGPATARIFDQKDQKLVWSHATDFSAGAISGLPRLQPGRFYLWSVVNEEGEGYAPLPFYLLSIGEEDRANKLLRTARTDASRAEILAKFGLFEELMQLSANAKRRFANGK